MKKLIPILVFLATIMSACGTNQSPQVFLPTINVVSYPTVQASQPASNQNVGGFNFNLSRAWRDGKTVYADVCFTLPDASNWTIWNAHFDYSDQSITDFSASLLSTQDAANGQPGNAATRSAFTFHPMPIYLQRRWSSNRSAPIQRRMNIVHCICRKSSRRSANVGLPSRWIARRMRIG